MGVIEGVTEGVIEGVTEGVTEGVIEAGILSSRQEREHTTSTSAQPSARCITIITASLMETILFHLFLQRESFFFFFVMFENFSTLHNLL